MRLERSPNCPLVRQVVESTSGTLLRKMAESTATEVWLLTERLHCNDAEQLSSDRAVYEMRARHEALQRGLNAAVRARVTHPLKRSCDDASENPGFLIQDVCLSYIVYHTISVLI